MSDKLESLLNALPTFEAAHKRAKGISAGLRKRLSKMGNIIESLEDAKRGFDPEDNSYDEHAVREINHLISFLTRRGALINEAISDAAAAEKKAKLALEAALKTKDELEAAEQPPKNGKDAADKPPKEGEGAGAEN